MVALVTLLAADSFLDFLGALTAAGMSVVVVVVMVENKRFEALILFHVVDVLLDSTTLLLLAQQRAVDASVLLIMVPLSSVRATIESVGGCAARNGARVPSRTSCR